MNILENTSSNQDMILLKINDDSTINIFCNIVLDISEPKDKLFIDGEDRTVLEAFEILAEEENIQIENCIKHSYFEYLKKEINTSNQSYDYWINY